MINLLQSKIQASVDLKTGLLQNLELLDTVVKLTEAIVTTYKNGAKYYGAVMEVALPTRNTWPRNSAEGFITTARPYFRRRCM